MKTAERYIQLHLNRESLQLILYFTAFQLLSMLFLLAISIILLLSQARVEDFKHGGKDVEGFALVHVEQCIININFVTDYKCEFIQKLKFGQI